MSKLIFRQKAVDDITDIWEYTVAEWSQNQAEKYYLLIQSACDKIAADFNIGKAYEAIHPGLHGYPIGRHIIFYQRVETGEVEVIRILHEQMDLKNRLGDINNLS